MVLLLLTFRLLLLPLWESVIVLFYVHSSTAIILTGKRELVTLLNLSSWCLLMVELAALPRGAMGLSAGCDCGLTDLTYSTDIKPLSH